MAVDNSINLDAFSVVLTPSLVEINLLKAWQDLRNVKFNDDVSYWKNGAVWPSGEIFWKLPADVIELMQKNLPVALIEQLIHADYIPYIDFYKNNEDIKCGRSFFLHHIAQREMTLGEYTLDARIRGGGPGILEHDVQEDWEKHVAYHKKKIAILAGETTP